MLYNDKQLIKYQDKVGGKNSDDLDGFYKDEEGNGYFVKAPTDKKELFTELLASLLLKEFIKAGLVDKRYQASLICPEITKNESGQYVLIADFVSFQSLYELIGTGNSDQSDRIPLFEMMAGPRYYPLLTKIASYFGLSLAMMFSLLFGANSVHSGNIVLLDNAPPDAPKQFARLDWGDAFRYYCVEGNNDDVLEPWEYKGWLNLKWFTKGYFSNYKNISGLFSSIAKQGIIFSGLLQYHGISLTQLVKQALESIPSDLIDSDNQAALAEYLGSQTFSNISFSEQRDIDKFALEISQVLETRLNQICKLNDMVTKDEGLAQYGSMEFEMNLDYDKPFPEILYQLALLDSTAQLQPEQIDLSKLIRQFNAYVDLIATQMDLTNSCDPAPTQRANMLTTFHDETVTNQEFGYAFIPEYREGAILRNLYYVISNDLTSNRPKLYETAARKYIEHNCSSPWTSIDNVLTYALGAMSEVKKLNDEQLIEQSPEMIEPIKANLTELLKLFNTTNKNLDLYLNKRANERSVTPQPSSFYPISEDRLLTMSGDQLVTICLEEMNRDEMSPLIVTIIRNDTLYQTMYNAFEAGKFYNRSDNPRQKIETIRKCRESILIAEMQTRQTVERVNQVVGLKRHQEVNGLLESARQLELTVTNEFDESSKSYRHAIAIVRGIRTRSERYMANPDDQLETVKQDLNQLIELHKSSLNQYPNLKNLLANLLLAVLLLGAGYVVAATVNKHMTDSYMFRFFDNSASYEQVTQLEETCRRNMDSSLILR